MSKTKLRRSLPTDPDALLDTFTLSQLFGVDRATICRWIREGQLPAISTPGRHYRVRAQVAWDALTNT